MSSDLLATPAVASVNIHSLSSAAKLLVQAFISTRLDYCNSLLYMISDELYRRLQAVQNASARLITNTRRCEHITPVLQQLHWLPVSQRVQFKIAVLVYEACVPGGRLPTCVCHSTPTTAFVGHRHVPSAANQHILAIAHSLLLDLA